VTCGGWLARVMVRLNWLFRPAALVATVVNGLAPFCSATLVKVNLPEASEVVVAPVWRSCTWMLGSVVPSRVTLASEVWWLPGGPVWEPGSRSKLGVAGGAPADGPNFTLATRSLKSWSPPLVWSSHVITSPGSQRKWSKWSGLAAADEKNASGLEPRSLLG